MDLKLLAIGAVLILGIGGFLVFNALQPVQVVKKYEMTAPIYTLEDAKLTSSDKPNSVELTIYQVEPNYYSYRLDNDFDLNNGLALIKERRSANLPSGLARFQMKGTAQHLDGTSLSLKDLTDSSSTTVLEQNYQYDLISSSKLMEKYLDQNVEVVVGSADKTGAKETIKGKLLSFADGLVLQTDTGIVTLSNYEKINYPTLPEGLITSPTIEWLLSNTKEGNHDFEASYLATGLNWNADYVAISNKDDNMLDITGWVSIKNNAGATFKDAKLKLVAGDINLVRNVAPQMLYAKTMDSAGAAAPAPQFTQENLFEYHLYTLQRPATLKDNEDKQITLFDAKNTPVQKQYVYEGDGTNVATKLIFENKKENNLGIPMPKGKVRVYKADSEGLLQFLGEDQIAHTPENEKVRLFLGNAFDIVAEKKETDRKEIGTCASQYTYSVELRNHKTTDIEVTVLQSAYGESSILNENFKSTKESSTQFSWIVPIKASGTSTLQYTIQQKYC